VRVEKDTLSDELGIGDFDVAFEKGEVIYDDNEKMNIIRKAVDILYDNWYEFEKSRNFDEKLRKEFQSWLSITSLFFKHSSFRDEEEYRYVAIFPTCYLSDSRNIGDRYRVKMYDFRINDGVFTPYISVSFCDKPNSRDNIISSIMISPSANREQKKSGLYAFIRSKHYPLTEDQIEYSSVPLRY
jgi:hypothetical protein